MRKLIRTTIAIAALAAANPLFAQDVDSDESASSTPERMEEFAGLMAGLFQTEPLTSEQQSRLPMAGLSRHFRSTPPVGARTRDRHG